ncbi:hypothetical protein Hamer_G019144, partial [Homarus americanus]
MVRLSRMEVAHASDQGRSMGSEQGTDHRSLDGVFTRNCHTVVTGQCVVDCWARGSWLLDRRTAALLCVLAAGMILKKKQETDCVGEKL